MYYSVNSVQLCEPRFLWLGLQLYAVVPLQAPCSFTIAFFFILIYFVDQFTASLCKLYAIKLLL